MKKNKTYKLSFSVIGEANVSKTLRLHIREGYVSGIQDMTDCLYLFVLY